MKKIFRFFLTIGVLGGLLGGGMMVYGAVDSPAGSDSSAGVKIQPALIEDKVDLGKTYSYAVTITNISPDKYTFYTRKYHIKGLTAEGSPIFAVKGKEADVDLSGWIKASDAPIELKPGQSKEIPFTVTVPNDASPGGHFAGFFLSVAPPELEETGSAVGFQIGTLLNLRVAGTIVEEARITEFSTDKKVYAVPEVTFSTSVENTGNVLIRPRGPIDITDFFGKKVASLILNDNNAGVLPKEKRIFTTIWKGEGLVIGPYSVVMTLTYGSEVGVKTVSRLLSFWVLPPKILYTVGGVIGAILLIIIVGARLHVRRLLRNTAAGSDSPRRRSSGMPMLLLLMFLFAIVGFAVLIMLLL